MARRGSSLCLLLQATAVLAALRQRGPGSLQFALPPLQLRTAARAAASCACRSAAATSRRAGLRRTDLLGVAADALPEGTGCMHFGLDRSSLTGGHIRMSRISSRRRASSLSVLTIWSTSPDMKPSMRCWRSL